MAVLFLAPALAYEKGRYKLSRYFQHARNWFQKLLQAYDSNKFLGDVDERFIAFQRRRLEYVTRAQQYEEDRARRCEQATDLERRIMDIEDRHRLGYQKAVKCLDRGDGSRQGQKHYRARVEPLRQQYIRQRELAVEKIKRETAEGN